MINKLLVAGNIDSDPELIHRGTERARCAFTIKMTELKKDKDGNTKRIFDFHRVVVFGKSADYAGDKLSKGIGVFVDGKIQSKKWEDKKGNKHSGYDIIANSITPFSMPQTQNEELEASDSDYFTSN